MPRPKGSKNKPKGFKEMAEEKVQTKQLLHDETEDIQISDSSASRILELAIPDIRDNPYQPRRFFDEESLKELAGSIKSQGLLNPVLVHKDEEGYFLVAGERRLRACRQLGMDTIKAVIVEADPEIASLVDNIQREDLHPMERALAVKKLLDRHEGATSRVAEIISIGVRSVQHLERISGLADMIDAGDKSEAVAKLTDNKIPLREFIQLSRYKDRTQLNAKFDEYKPMASGDPTGKRIPNTAEFSLGSGLIYQHPSGFFLGFDATRFGTKYLDEMNTLKQDPYTLVNAKLGYKAEHWHAALVGKNLGDERYVVRAFQFMPGLAPSVMAAPLSVGVELGASF